MNKTAHKLAITGGNKPINTLLASESEEFLRNCADLFLTKANRIRSNRKQSMRGNNLAPWKEEAKRWTAGQHVYFGTGWCYSNIDIFTKGVPITQGADIPEGQRAKVYQVCQKGVWLTLPKKVQVANKQRDGRNLQWISWHDIMRHEVSRVAISARVDSWRPYIDPK